MDETLCVRIDSICQQLNQLTEQQYQKYDFTPNKNVKVGKEKEMSDYQLKVYQNSVKKDHYRKHRKALPTVDKNIKKLDINGDFNMVVKSNEYMDWKSYSLDERRKLLDQYFTDNNIEEDIKTKVMKIFEDGFLTTKKEISFDKINVKVMDIPLIKTFDAEYMKNKMDKARRTKNKQQLKRIFK